MSNAGAFSMWDLFRAEVASQMQVFTDGLIAIEGGAEPQGHLAAAMRAAHSIKGAARIVQLDVAVRLAHVMEDCLVAAQAATLVLNAPAIDVLLAAGDLLSQLSSVPEASVSQWVDEQGAAIDEMVGRLDQVRAGTWVRPTAVPPASSAPTVNPAVAVQAPTLDAPSSIAPPTSPPAAARTVATPQGVALHDRTLKVGAQTLNRLMGLAGESLVQSRWFEPFSESLLTLKRRQQEISELLDSLQIRLEHVPGDAAEMLASARTKLETAHQTTAARHTELEAFALRSTGLSDRLYREVVATRMCPFGDGVEGFPRLVRDIARQLGKQAQIEILGRTTEVDREILERLEAPLNHSIRNSLDHGLESPEERAAAGKPAVGTIRLEARHRAGLFVLTVSDDGRGVDVQRLRVKVVERGLATPEMAANFSEAELLEFLFLPGFSTAAAVTNLSGRGVGLDAVQDMVKSVGGAVRLTSRFGKGVTLSFELPLTLSVLRTLVTEIGGEPFALPLTRIAKAVVVPLQDLVSLEGQQYFTLDGERIGVVPAHEVLRMAKKPQWGTEIPVVLLGDRSERYGLAVDRFVGEYDMVVRPLDGRLGKVRDVSASALMEDGSPVLILDVEDLIRSVATELQGGRLRGLGHVAVAAAKRRRILVVDDSITVREVERSLLRNRGYEVDVAVDGMDGWNALRSGNYDLTVSDVDMPRMTGIELVSRIKADARLQNMPVIMVSYKDREEDRLRGLEAGADRYMTKSSFHDETLVAAVLELIGPPRMMRIAIVNDMPMAVEALRRVVGSVPDYEVAWIARDGDAAVQQCAADVPDLVLMDLMMPVMDGAEATRLIMQQSPCAILVVTATVGGHASKVFEAMGWGALDAVDTPVLGLAGDPAGATPLLTKIAMLSKLTGQSRPRSTTIDTTAIRALVSETLPLVAIGASTGGPAALVRVIGGLPRDLRAAITIVQHVDEQFAPGLASWLGTQTGHDVRIVQDDDRPVSGRVLMASTNDHLVLTPAVAFRYTSEPADYPYRPSVDMFFQSIVNYWPGPAVGVLLTGMGADGAQGLLSLRHAGCHTIAQDQATSVVYGMPKAAVKLNAAVEVLPIDDIAAAIVRAVQAVRTRRRRKRSQT